MCARVLAGFLRSHFHDNFCTVLDEYVRAEVSFANLGVHKEAQALVEQGGTVTRGGCRVHWQKSYRRPWTRFTRGNRGSAHRSAPGAAAAPAPRASGAAAAPPAPAPQPTSGSNDGDRRRHQRSRSGTRERSRSPSRERRPCRHGGPRRSRSRSPPSLWPRHVDSYYGDQYLCNPLTSPTGPPFQYGAAYGYLPAHSGVATPPRISYSPPRWDIACSLHWETGKPRSQVRPAPHNRDLGHG